MNTKEYRVVIVDDDLRVIDSLAALLLHTTQLRLVGEARDGIAGLDVVRSTKPHLVVIDVRMPAGGADLVRALKVAIPEVTVVALSAYCDVSMVAEMLSAGLTGFFTKGQLSEHFTDELARCAAGEVIISCDHAKAALDRALRGHPR